MRLRWSSLIIPSNALAIGILLAAPAYATDLYDAVRASDVASVALLLKSGADPNVKSPYDSPLHVAARFGPPEMVMRLLDAGADIELPGYGGSHPLHAAVLNRQDVIVSLLLDRGARVDSVDNLGRTPLLALASGAVYDLAVLKTLLEAGADANLFDGPIRFRALDYAAMHGRADVAKILLAFGAEINAQDNILARTPLHYAIACCRGAMRGHQEVVQLLIDQGADVNARGAHGLTPLEYAKRYAPNNGLIYIMLIKGGAK